MHVLYPTTAGPVGPGHAAAAAATLVGNAAEPSSSVDLHVTLRAIPMLPSVASIPATAALRGCAGTEPKDGSVGATDADAGQVAAGTTVGGCSLFSPLPAGRACADTHASVAACERLGRRRRVRHKPGLAGQSTADNADEAVELGRSTEQAQTTERAGDDAGDLVAEAAVNSAAVVPTALEAPLGTAAAGWSAAEVSDASPRCAVRPAHRRTDTVKPLSPGEQLLPRNGSGGLPPLPSCGERAARPAKCRTDWPLTPDLALLDKVAWHPSVALLHTDTKLPTAPTGICFFRWRQRPTFSPAMCACRPRTTVAYLFDPLAERQAPTFATIRGGVLHLECPAERLPMCGIGTSTS